MFFIVALKSWQVCVCAFFAVSVSVHACEPRLHSVHFCTRWLITHRVCLVVERGHGEWRGMSTLLVYDKVTENHWGVKCTPHPPPSNPPLPRKTPAAVQKVHGVGSLPFNETIKGPMSPSIDFSHSFSDKFELIIQQQAPGDVYFQHEGQLIHSVSPSSLLCLSFSRFISSVSLLFFASFSFEVSR